MTNCPLCEALSTEPEEMFVPPLYDGDYGFEILKTKNMKGHTHRYMIVIRGHTDTVHDYTKRYAIGRLVEFMLEKCPGDFVILETTHASITDHFHLVASTLNEGNDQDLIRKTPRLEIKHCQAE